jgi:hypothetical protein
VKNEIELFLDRIGLIEKIKKCISMVSVFRLFSDQAALNPLPAMPLTDSQDRTAAAGFYGKHAARLNVNNDDR